MNLREDEESEEKTVNSHIRTNSLAQQEQHHHYLQRVHMDFDYKMHICVTVSVHIMLRGPHVMHGSCASS